MNLILTIILAIIIIILIILNNGLKIDTKYKITDNTIKLQVKLKILNIIIFKKQIPEKNKKPEKEEKNNKKFNTKEILNLIKTNINQIKKILKIFKNSSKILKIENNIIIGLEDYVKTTEIIGYIYLLKTILNIEDNIYLTAEPEFNKETINIDGKLIFKTNILKILIDILKNREIISFIKKVREVLG